MTADKRPLIGWMILEGCCEDMSAWDGVISYPDPTGANLAWENTTKMIEFSAYDALREQLAEYEKAISSILWIDECRCDIAYTGRGRHEPNSYCGELDPLREALAKWKEKK